MDCMILGSGDNLHSPRCVDEDEENGRESNLEGDDRRPQKLNEQQVTSQSLDDNEKKLKDRISQCRHVIESLKFELNEEKAKLEKESKFSQPPLSIAEPTSTYHSGYRGITNCDDMLTDMSYSSNIYGACVENKLACDENLMEYEKQLQKYQNTLNMAQIEKKNAIRKQMLTKAYKLKLLEVENQCNIELLRVKQSLQCLEPLKMIANKWKSGCNDTLSDYSSFDLPRLPQFSANSEIDLNSYADDNESQPEAGRSVDKNHPSRSEFYDARFEE